MVTYNVLPVTTPYSDGNTTSATANLEVGNWVIGFFLDEDGQDLLLLDQLVMLQIQQKKFHQKEIIKKEKNLSKHKVDRDHNPPVNAPADESVKKNPNKAGHPPGVDERTASALISVLMQKIQKQILVELNSVLK